MVSFAYKNQVDGIGAELFQFSQDLDTSAAAAVAAQAAVEASQQHAAATAAAAAVSPASSSTSAEGEDEDAVLSAKTTLAKAQTHFAQMDSEQELAQQQRHRQEEEDSARVLVASLTVAYNDATLRCEQLEGHLRFGKQRLAETNKLRVDLHTSLQRLSKRLSGGGGGGGGASSGEEEEEEGRADATPSALSTRKPRKSAVAKPASALQVGKRHKYDSDDDEYGSEEADLDAGGRNPGKVLPGKLTRVSSGACPECGKMRHRDKKLNPNVCPFLLWTKDFGKHVPRKPGDDTLLCAQKLAWPLVKRHFVDEDGLYIKLDGASWNGPSAAPVEVAAPPVVVAAAVAVVPPPPPPPPPHHN